MIVSDINQIREYIVTVRKDVDCHIIHDELCRDTSADDSVDSNIVPDRVCECCKERPNNPRNTHYNLSEAEAIKLRQDSRILAVQAVEDIPEPKPRAFQDGDFNRLSTATGQNDNWGLLRHTNQTNTFNNSQSDPGGTYDYVLDGTGVDMVIVDTGIQDGHPEWNDANGVSRLQKINWFTESGVSGTQPANFYTDVNGHGSHCVGTMAGKTFGWCKNSDIYNITLYSNTGNNISWADTIDSLIGWHNNKPIDPATGVKRPTVVNMSFGYVWYIRTTTTPNAISFNGTTYYDITGGRYRGVTHTDTAYANLQNRGLIGEAQGGGVYGFPRKFASEDADVETLINNGIHVCCAAGNDSMKIDVPGGVDYDNYLTFTFSGQTYYMYYHRGGTPSVNEGGDTFTSTATQDNPVGDLNEGFMVGATDAFDVQDGAVYRDRKTGFSQSGPGVNIYTAGRYIISAQPNNQGSTYFADASYRQAKHSGTSMAAPQMCGMIGLLTQAHPDWTPAQVKKYFESNSVANLNDTGNNNDYTTSITIHGGPNRVAYFPMNGQRPFSQTSGALAPGGGVPPGGGESYALSASSESITEGENTTFTLTTTNVADGIDVAYTITGVSSSDLDNGPRRKTAAKDFEGPGSAFFKREMQVGGVRLVIAGGVGGQTAVPDLFADKVARMFELFTDSAGAGINAGKQNQMIETLLGNTTSYHSNYPTIQRIARGAGGDYTPNFLTDAGISAWGLSPLFDATVQNDMVWYLNSTGGAPGDGDIDAQEVIEHVFHTLHMHGIDAVTLKMYPFISADWATGDLYNAMAEAFDGNFWDPSGYQTPSNAWKTDPDAFEVAVKEYLYLLNFCMFDYSSLWDGESLSPEWTDAVKTPAGILANNPLGYALFNTHIADVISKPSLTTIRTIFQDGDVGNPALGGASGYVPDAVIPLTGNFTVSSNSATLTLNVAKDGVVDVDSLTVALDNGEANQAVTIADDGVTPGFAPDYALYVTNPGGNEYTLSGYDRNGLVSGAQPTLAYNNGDKVIVTVQGTTSSSHPFYIKTAQGSGTGNQASGVDGQGTVKLEWTIGSTGTFYYQCSIHSAMNNTIIVS
jgi:hypothetical protein